MDWHALRDGLSSGTAGQLITVFGLGYAMLAPTLAPAVSKRSRRVALAGGLAVFRVANGLAALAPGYALLLAARVQGDARFAVFAVLLGHMPPPARPAPPMTQCEHLARPRHRIHLKDALLIATAMNDLDLHLITFASTRADPEHQAAAGW